MGNPRRSTHPLSDRYAAWLASLGRSPATVLKHRQHVDRFIAAGHDPVRVDRATIDTYLEQIPETTRRTAVAALRGFMAWLVDQRLRRDNPTPRDRRILDPVQLTLEEIKEQKRQRERQRRARALDDYWARLQERSQELREQKDRARAARRRRRR